MQLIQHFKDVLLCPACGSSHSVEYGNKIEGFEEIVDGVGLFNHPAFKVLMCKNCLLYFKSCVPDGSVLAQYYASLNIRYENVDIVFPTDKVIFNRAKSAEKNITLLDYGCGSGRLLAKFPQTARKFGVEVNQDAIEVATSRNVTIIPESELDARVGFFDVVLLTDVYEHLAEPLRLVRRLSACLKPGGKLIISTGVADSVKYKERIGHYWYFKLFSHLQMATCAHFHWLAQQLDFRLITIDLMSHYDSSLKSSIGKSVADILFQIARFKVLSKLSRATPILKSARKWNYPIFDQYNKDHAVCVLQKRAS